MELKNTLKKHRQDKGLTQEELASLLGVSRQTIISIERYRYKPSLELGLKISNLLAIDINKLFYLSSSDLKIKESSEENKIIAKTKKFKDFKDKDWKELWNKLKK
jgi:putative transcriptional regulator